MANYDEDSDVDMEEIISRNNITDKLAIDILREIAKARNNEDSRSRSSSTSSEVSLELNTNGYESECESTSGSSESCDSQTSVPLCHTSILEPRFSLKII